MLQIELGLFDIQQVDPLLDSGHHAFYQQRLDDLSYADGLGFNIAFVAERHYLPTYRCQASSAWIGAASQRARSMRLGVLAHTLPITPPVRLAEEIALLDQLTNGRIEVGVGLGHRVEELFANAVDPENRVSIFQERLAVMEALWSGGTISFQSEHTSVRDVFIHPTPVQRPHPPLWFAGTEPNAAMWAGQHGMNLAVGFAQSARLFGTTNAFRQGVAIRQSRSTDDDDVRRGTIALMRQVIVGDSDTSVRTEMVDDLMRLGELNQSGTESNRAARKKTAREQLERLIADEVFIGGSPDTVTQSIVNARNQLGASMLLANVWAAGIEQERVRRTMALLAGPVRDGLDAITTRV